MIRPISVLLPDGECPLILRIIQALACAPHTRIHLLSPVPWPTARFSRHLDSFYVRPPSTLPSPTSTPQSTIDAILRTAKKTQANVLLPMGEPMARLLAENRDAFRGIIALAPLPPPHIHDLVCDKGALALHMQKHHIPGPLTVVQETHESNADFTQRIAATLRFPLLVKATRAAYGHHMTRCNSAPEALDFLNAQLGSGRQFLAQEFIPGQDVDTCVLYHQGLLLAASEKSALVPNPRPFAPPPAWHYRADPAIRAVAESLLTPLQWSGPANLDIRRDSRDGSLKLLEVNGRFWGSILGSLQAGINFPHLACLTALGHTFPRPEPRETRFLVNSTGLKPTLRSLFHSPTPTSFSFHQTNLPHHLADPLPLLVDHLKARLPNRR